MSAVMVVGNLNQQFGGLRALKDVSFDVVEGEVLGIIGPNGAGKSTLFNAIVGVVPPISGTVLFREENIVGKPVHAVVSAGVVKTSQSVQVFTEMTVLDNVAVAALRAYPSIRAARAAAEEELEFWGLAAFAGSTADSLTPALRSTLELARAMMLSPTILLVDEVMAGLNEIEVDQMLDRMGSINRDRKVTLMVIEHNMRALMKISHRILALDYGSVIALGEPTAVSRDRRVIDAYLGAES